MFVPGKHYTGLERLVSDKHSYLIRKSLNYSHNKFYDKGPRRTSVWSNKYGRTANSDLSYFVQLGFDKADTLKSSSMLIYYRSEHSLYTQADWHDATVIKSEIKMKRV